MKKLISFVCVVLVVFCMMNVFEEKPQAAFVVDDAFIVSVIGSVLLSIAVSEGIAIATGGESVYTGVANALWDYFLTGEAQGDVNEAINKLRLYGSFAYQGGKLYFALNQNGYNFFKSWISGTDFEQFHTNANLVTNNSTLIESSTGYSLASNVGKYSIGEVTSLLSYTAPSFSAVYNPTGKLSVSLSDGFTMYRDNLNINHNELSIILFTFDTQGGLSLFYGGKTSGNNFVSASPTEATGTKGRAITTVGMNAADRYSYNGETVSFTYQGSYPNYRVYLNNNLICRCDDILGYYLKCILAGCILTNVNNNITDVNTNSNVTSVSKPVEFEEVAPAIPNNTGIGRNQVALIPVPGNTVDSEDESIVLSPGQVKDYDRQGKDYTFIPVPGQLQGKTGADLGVTVMNKTTFEETSTPVYTGSVPDVFPTASPDVTITAGADVFPTVAPTEAPTVGEGSTADAIAGDISDIKDEVGDLSTPLTPPQAQTGTNKLKIPQLLLTKFPFCIPYDFYNAINQFNAEAEMPSFDIPFHFAQINFDYTMHIDFERFTSLAKICQWFFSVSWVVILILLTRKVIWK